MLSAKEQKLLDALEPTATDRGIEIVTVEVAGARKAPTIRVYIDAEGGVSFDALASAQAWINQIMDELDPFPGAYTLEVSSPGIDRPLRTLRHFADAEGQVAALVMAQPVDGRSKWTGIITGVEDDSVLLDVDGICVALDWDNIKKAHVKGVVDFK